MTGAAGDAERSDAKRRLLAQRLAAKATPSNLASTVEPIPSAAPGPPPLSAGQAALLYEHRLRPDRAGYNIVHLYHVYGVIDLNRLERAILSAVNRHQPLLTSFGPQRRTLEMSEAAQVVEVALDETAFESLAAREATRRFDLENGPLVRAFITRFGVNHHAMILALHHVSSDAASLSALWRDIDRAYHGHLDAEPHTTYGDHAAWQASRITDDDRRFWAQHLGADPHGVELPLAAPAPAEPDGYATVAVPLPAASLRDAGLRALPFFLTTLAALAQRYTDTEDVVIGLVASNRDHPAVEDLVGYFLTVLPIKLTVDPSHTITALTKTADATVARALTHRHVPYAEVAADLRRRGVDQPDPARVMFVFDDGHTAMLTGCRIESRLVHNGVSVADLTIFVRRRGDVFETSAEWNGARYGRRDVTALLEEFVRLACWCAAHPAAPVLNAPAQTDACGPEFTRPLVPLPTLISQQCLHCADLPAVRCGSDRLDYATLGERAERVATALRGWGVGRGDRVAVLLGRSADLVAVVVGVGRIGAAYVPIDPSYPDARTALILQASGAVVTVTDASGAARAAGPTLTVEQVFDGPAPAPASSTAGDAALEDPAYVIFTSGSTGTPRGVEVRHRQLAASTLARLDHYAEPVGAFLMVSSIGFDSSIVGLFWTLATGGEVVLPTEDEVHDIDRLGELIETARISHLLMVPTLYSALLARHPTRLTTLRCCIVAGEACPASLVERHTAIAGRATLSNEYGPTECTVWATAHTCKPGEDPVPIGSAIAGVRLRVADRWMRPRPPGCAGELVIGGAGVVDGYLDDVEGVSHTSSVTANGTPFVIDPHTGQRFYRSGDLVRRQDDDVFSFLGRVDHQLSLGGVRIEPEEIEAALTSLDGVTAAVVRIERQLDEEPLDALARLDNGRAADLLAAASRSKEPAKSLGQALAEHAAGTDILVAYVEPGPTAAEHATRATEVTVPIDLAELRDALRDRLPAAVVPSVFEILPRLPRNEHGKVDRRALRPPLRTRRDRVAGAMAPVPPDNVGTVTVFVDSWRRVLNDPDLNQDSDFFASGGDSLLAVELVTALEERLGGRIPISALVLGRTPRRLASLVGTPTVDMPATSSVRRSYLVPLRPFGQRPPLVILPPGGGNLVVFDPFVGAFDPQFPVYGFDLPGADRDDELPDSVESLCDTYLPQLRAAQPHGPYRFLGWSFGGVVALELAQRLRAAGESVDLVAMIDTLMPGMQRAGRARAYRNLLHDGDLAGVAHKLVQLVKVRIMLKVAQRKGRRAAARGDSLTPSDRNTWLTIKVDEMVERYRPSSYDGSVVFFAAADTHPWRSTEPWRALIADFEVIAIDGSHEGSDGLLSGERVARIAAEIAARLH